MKKKTNNPPKFGFGDALFGLKSLQGEYQNIDEAPFKQPPPPQPPIKKPTQVKTTQIKPSTPVKPTNNKSQNMKPTVKKIIEPPTTSNTVFKVNPGTEHTSLVQVQLLPSQVLDYVTELTLKGKPSRWEYCMFGDGAPISTIVEDLMVGFGFEAEDVQQGNLGNCYFLASVASLAHLPRILRQRIPSFKKYGPNTTLFKVYLFESGKCIEIDVDHLFSKIYSKPVGNDVSIMLLEKAYAQLYGNYQMLNVGHSTDSLRDLTGAPSEYLEIKNKAKLKQGLQQVFAEKYPIVIASKTAISHNHISPKHSYNVLHYRIKNNDIYLKLRDPRGRNFQKVAMPLQDHISIEEKKNGVFWINYDMLVSNFEVITYSKVKQGYHYFYKTFTTDELPYNESNILVTVLQPTIMHFSIHQSHKKLHDDHYQYEVLRLLIGSVQVHNGKVTYGKMVTSNYNCQQVCHVSCQLPPGQYLMIGGISGQHKRPRQLTLSFYCSSVKLDFNLVKGPTHCEPFIKQYMLTHKHQFKESNSSNNLSRHFGQLYGHVCMLYHNNSIKSVIQELKYTTENVNTKDTKVQLAPQQSKVLMHSIGNKNNCSIKFSFKTNTLFK